MGDLPRPVEEAGLLFQRAGIQNDPQAMDRIIAWGHEQITVAYPEDPLRAPLNPFRRWLARWEWNRVIRTAGRDLRGTIASTMVQELAFEIERRQTDILARDAEVRRQEAVRFDTGVRIQELDLTEQVRLKNDKERMNHAHKLQQEAEDAASYRRMAERVNETEQEIIHMTTRAILESAGTSSAQEVLDLVTKVSNEVTRIRHDDSLDDDDKHLHVKTLLETLPEMLRRAKES